MTNRFISFLRMILLMFLVSFVLLGIGKLKAVAKAEEWNFAWNNLWNDVIDSESDNGIKIRTIDEYLFDKGSPLTGCGVKYVEVAQKYNLPVYLMVAMAGAESGFGTKGYAVGTYNSVGLGVHEGRSYQNWQEGIDDLGYVLRNFYFDEGKDDLMEIQNKWAPRGIDGNGWDNSWASNVDFFIRELEAKEKEVSS